MFFGRSAGVLSALIYLLGPPLVAYWGVVAMGFHAESALFSVVGIGLLLALATAARRSRLGWLAFGVISGLGIWFTPTAAIGVLACVLAWPLLAPRPRGVELATAALGLGLGLAPWLVYNAAHDFAGVTRLLEVFGLEGSADPWRSQGVLERARDLFVRAPTEGLLDPGADHASFSGWSAVVAGVWIPAGLALLAAGRRAVATLRAGPRHAAPEARSELVFGVYALLFVLVYLGSRFTLSLDPSPIAYRLIVPFAVLLIPPIAISAARGIAAQGTRRRLALTACAVGLLSLATATLGFALHHEADGTPLTLERADVAFGHILQRKYGNDLPAAVAALGWLPDARRARVLSGIGWGLQSAQEQVGEIGELARALERLEPGARARVEQGIRYWTHQRRARLAPLVESTGDADSRRALTRLDALDAWIRRPPLVLITLDTTRVDHLSCYGYERNTTPRLDAFAAPGGALRAGLVHLVVDAARTRLPLHRQLPGTPRCGLRLERQRRARRRDRDARGAPRARRPARRRLHHAGRAAGRARLPHRRLRRRALAAPQLRPAAGLRAPGRCGEQLRRTCGSGDHDRCPGLAREPSGPSSPTSCSPTTSTRTPPTSRAVATPTFRAPRSRSATTTRR